jgi:hypothetical protein
VDDDFAFVWKKDLYKAVLTSNRLGGIGDDDIYAFALSKPIQQVVPSPTEPVAIVAMGKETYAQTNTTGKLGATETTEMVKQTANNSTTSITNRTIDKPVKPDVAAPTGSGALFATGADVVAPTNLSTYNFSPAAKSVMEPTIGDKFTQVGDYLRTTGTNLMADPIGTIGSGIKSTYELAKEYPTASILAATAAIGALTPQQPGEPDNTYQQRKAEHDAKVAQYITQYGGGAKVYSPSFYAMEGAVDPFAGRSTYAADGGQITNRQNYFFGSKVSAVATPQSGGGTGGGGFMGGMLSKLIQQNPQMFRPQGTTVRQPRTGEFIDINKNGITI